jgi:hypothetical protein
MHFSAASATLEGIEVAHMIRNHNLRRQANPHSSNLRLSLDNWSSPIHESAVRQNLRQNPSEKPTPFADIGQMIGMLRCGPSNRTFMHGVAFLRVKRRFSDFIAVRRNCSNSRFQQHA